MANNDRLFSTKRKKRKLKDKKIDFVKRVPEYDKYGAPIRNKYTYETVLSNLWAYVRQTSAKEVAEYVAGAITTDYIIDLLFTINYRDDIKNDMLIKFNGKYYEVKRIDNFEFYKEDIVISASRYVSEDD